ENRNGLAVDATLTCATGTAEREAALVMLDRRERSGRITLGADKAFDVTDFVEDLRERKVTPHVAINGRISKHGVIRKTAVDRRTTRHAGYGISQILRKRIEEVRAKAEPVFTFAIAAYNLIRLPKLLVHTRA